MQYWQSTKGEEMYKKVELPYPSHPFDKAYQRFHRITRSSPEKENKFIINRIIRRQLPGDEEDKNQEVILYDLLEIRLDGLGNVKRFGRTNLGQYPIPQRTVIRTFDEDNQPVIKTGSVSEVHTGYEFPFTKEKAEELHKWCVDKVTASRTKKTEYIVERLGERKISCKSYKDWLTGDFENLYATGRADGILDEGPIKPNKTRKTKLQQEREEKLQYELAQYQKPYTTNLKPIKLNEENNNYEERI
jgi:hypothetical protein